MTAIPTGEFSSPGDYTIMFAALENGALDAVACSHQVAKNYTEANDKLVTIDQVMATDGTHAIAQKGHDQLMAKVSAAVEAFVASSDYQTIADKWGIIL